MKKYSIAKIILDTMKAFMTTMLVMLLIWAFVSWLNVGFNNESALSAAQDIWDWNLFKLLVHTV